MVDTPEELERIKYETIWGHYLDYRRQADGDPVVEMAFNLMGCKAGERLIDYGCGKGTPAQRFADKGLKVLGADIAHNCLDEGIKIPLVTVCLWDIPKEFPITEYAFCTDVLEHLPPDKVDAAIKGISAHTMKAAFFQVCTLPDSFGKTMNPPQTLHLTVQPPEWWQAKFYHYWRNVENLHVKGKARSAFLCTVPAMMDALA